MAKSHGLTHAARVLRIRGMLDAQPFVTIAELQQEFGVTRRTVYNDLEALQSAGVPLFAEKGPSGEARWQLTHTAKKQTVTLSAGQVVPFGLALRALGFLGGTDVHDQMMNILDTLAKGASPATKQQLERLGHKVAIVPHGPKSYEDKIDVLDDILTGLFRDHLIEIWHRTPGKARAKAQVIAPLSLVLYREALYLVGQCTDGQRRTFAVDRILRSKWLKRPFVYPTDYDPAQFLDGSFGLIRGEPTEVEVIFDAAQAPYVRERQWHPTQIFEELPDGRVRMRMTVAGIDDVQRWLLGHTGTVEVRKPAELRKAVHAAAARTMKRHGPLSRR